MKYFLPKHALIVHNALSDKSPRPLAPVTDDDTRSTAVRIQNILIDHGVDAKLYPVDTQRDLTRLRVLKTELIFNCVDDDIGDIPMSSHLIPKIAGEMRVPFTGGSSGNILLTTNKAATKQFLLVHEIPTPPFVVISDRKQLPEMSYLYALFPLIVKPVSSDGSEGVTQRSIVSDQKHLAWEVSRVIKTYNQPALVEQFIPDREINVAVIEKQGRPFILPPSEIYFTKDYGQRYKIVDFEAKWRPETPQYHNTPGICPAPLSPRLFQKLRLLTLSVWNVLSLQGYTRVDYRVDTKEFPYVLEVNLNPDISDDSETGFPRAAKAAGLSYEQMILTIVSSAMYRYR